MFLGSHVKNVPGLRLNKVKAHSMLSSAEGRGCLVQSGETSLVWLTEQSLEVEQVFFRLVFRLLRLHGGDGLELREADSSLLVVQAGWQVNHFVNMGRCRLCPFQFGLLVLYNRRQATYVGLRNLLSPFGKRFRLSFRQRLWFSLFSGSLSQRPLFGGLYLLHGAHWNGR